MKRVLNAKTMPEIFYGLHMVEGVAEYREPGKDPYRIMVGETTIKNMDPSFAGRPVYVQHVEEVDLANIQAEADGYVVESFFNKADGKHWVKFIAVSDEAKQKIRQGWKLSNAYIPAGPFGRGGSWHGVDYEKEVLDGEYEHLAIVPNPRYQESVIMTPDQFKKYNADKETELLRLANSKEGEQPMLKMFKKQKVENQADLESMSVVLPKSGKEMTILQVVNALDEKEMHEAKPDHMANMEHLVEHGGEKMKLQDFMNKYEGMCNELKALKDAGGEGEKADIESLDNDEDEEAKKKALELKKDEEKPVEEKKKENEEEEKKKEDPKKEEAKKNAADKKDSNFSKLKNAHKDVVETPKRIELSEDKVARGKSRYGSK